MSNLIGLQDLSNATYNVASIFATGWTEAAARYVNWLNTESASRMVAEIEKYNKFSSEIERALTEAGDKASVWARAAIDAGDTGTGKIMERYSYRFAAQAEILRVNGANALANLNGLAADIRATTAMADNAMGGAFGRAIGPAFDAYSMMYAAVEWVNTGESEKFGGAAMGVLLSTILGSIGAGIATTAGAPIIAVLAVAAAGAMIGSSLGNTFFRAFRDFIQDGVNDLYLSARRWVAPRDPLVLDLDGDGIETIGIAGNSPILFDHDADGTRTGTGWVKPDDGLVVLDRNGNGLIDSGRELFGNETLLADGSKAPNGYAALAQHDSNGDGRISSADAVYGQLRIWQDTNQDGISQAGELHTLADLGIASIGVLGSEANVDLGNGNSMPLRGTFTRTDGSAGTSAAAQLSGSLLLASNGFYREFSDDPALADAAKALPQMRGSGWVRDLRGCRNRISKKIASSAGSVNARSQKHLNPVRQHPSRCN